MAKSNRSSSASSSVKGKTTRATMINLLLKNQGKVVTITAIKAAVIKLKGFSPETAEKKIKARTKEVAAWAKERDLKLVKVSNGFKLNKAA